MALALLLPQSVLRADLVEQQQEDLVEQQQDLLTPQKVVGNVTHPH